MSLNLLSRAATRTTIIASRRLGPASFFSDDSHSDFAPKKKIVADDDEAQKMIHEHVQNNHIMLYMKGNPSAPQCGFSASVVKMLQEQGADFSSVNVMDYPTIRDGVKKYSEWPTIPQLYVGGEFIGGCDIITGMYESGELKDLVKAIEEKKA
jgi:monothiol glutaredoxin|eukprot:scaffold2837_cov249-Chaetoceros_neogracile.AAC.4